MQDNEFAGEEELFTQKLRDMLETVGREPRMAAVRTAQQAEQNIVQQIHQDQCMVSEQPRSLLKKPESVVIEHVRSASRELSPHQHTQFIHKMLKDKEKRREAARKRQLSQQAHSREVITKEKEATERKLALRAEQKQRQIKQHLKQMRQNHAQIMAKQSASRKVVQQLKSKQHLFQKNQQQYQKIFVRPVQEQQAQILKQLKQQHKLNIEEIKQHQRNYLSTKRAHSSSQATELNSSYVPPSKSKRLAELIKVEEERKRRLLAQQREQAQRKVSRMADYSAIINKQIRPRIHTQPANHTVAATPVRKQTLEKEDRVKIGNQYLHLGQLKAKARKTSTQQVHTQNVTPPRRMKTQQTDSLPFVPAQQRDSYVLSKKKQEMQRLLSWQQASPRDCINRLNTANIKLQKALDNRQGDQEEVMGLLIATIKAKITLLGGTAE